ncbi:GNAT family N-acetyltransferase [Streptomyces sp. OZ13]|uniref:GNAT family N-acetyltransferase n=1 Tax=Streptomyces sp. OZ13 TaxID=3452210 RepID=UPI003F8BBA9C
MRVRLPRTADGHAGAYDRAGRRAVVLRAQAAPDVPSLLLRPWCEQDVAALIEAYQEPAMRRWAGSAMETDADAARWVQAQRQGWATGTRFAFAVLATRPGSSADHLVGNVVLKEVSAGKPFAEVGYWTTARARGRGVASRALEVLTRWAFDTFGGDGLERLELLHQVDNPASCRVAEKCRYAFDRVLPAAPPAFPLDGHLHTRHKDV